MVVPDDSKHECLLLNDEIGLRQAANFTPRQFGDATRRRSYGRNEGLRSASDDQPVSRIIGIAREQLGVAAFPFAGLEIAFQPFESRVGAGAESPKGDRKSTR